MARPATELEPIAVRGPGAPSTVELAATFRMPELRVAIFATPALMLANELVRLYGAGAVPATVGWPGSETVVDPSNGMVAWKSADRPYASLSPAMTRPATASGFIEQPRRERRAVAMRRRTATPSVDEVRSIARRRDVTIFIGQSLLQSGRSRGRG